MLSEEELDFIEEAVGFELDYYTVKTAEHMDRMGAPLSEIINYIKEGYEC